MLLLATHPLIIPLPYQGRGKDFKKRGYAPLRHPIKSELLDSTGDSNIYKKGFASLLFSLTLFVL